MRLLYLPFFFLFIISCSESNRYEYILKDDNFKSNFKLNKDQNFVDLEEGFTFYNAVNQNSQKTPVVLIHGFSVPSYIWSPTYKMLKEKGFYVISPDLFGRGNSKNIDGDYTDELFANQVLQLLNHLEIDKADFVGLSNGGRVISKIAFDDGSSQHGKARLASVASNCVVAMKRSCPSSSKYLLL